MNSKTILSQAGIYPLRGDFRVNCKWASSAHRRLLWSSQLLSP